MKITPELLQKYQQGHCTAEESSFVKTWLETGSIEDDFQFSEPDADETNIGNEIWKNLNQHIDDSEKRNIFIRYYQQVKPYASAAAILLFFGIGILFITRYLSKPVVPTSDNSPKAVPSEIAYTYYTTQPGERKRYVLPDGSEVYLNAASQLSVPVHFTDSSRSVYLRGQAFFKVTKDPARPFRIYTSESLTQVLGTSFDLKAYANETTTLTVKEGKVKFGKTDFIFLTANQQGVLESKNLFKKEVAANGQSDWVKNTLLFNDEPMAEMVPVLERWFGVQIQIKNSTIGTYSYKGKFHNPALPELLEDLSFAMNFKYSIKNRTVIIY